MVFLSCYDYIPPSNCKVVSFIKYLNAFALKKFNFHILLQHHPYQYEILNNKISCIPNKIHSSFVLVKDFIPIFIKVLNNTIVINLT